MRIAYITQSYPPMISGASIVVEQLAQDMAAHGHQVLVIAASDKNHPYISTKKNLTIQRLRSMYHPLRVGQRFLVYPRASILKALEKFQPDIIHSHEPILCWVGFEYAQRRHIPTTFTVHMLPWYVTAVFTDRGGLDKAVEKAGWKYLDILARKSTSVITTTKTVTDIVTGAMGIDSETIPCGIDTRLFHPPLSDGETASTRRRLNLPLDVPIILHVGRLDPEKMVERVIHAAAEVMKSSPAHLLIVGDGKEKEKLVSLAKALEIQARVHFTGYMSMNDGLPDVYRLANVFVMASEVESQGLVLLEAAASGLPLAAFEATSIPEVVHHGENGYLVKPGDARAMAEAIAQIIEAPALAKQMGEESRRLAENYDHERVQLLHEQYYRKLIKQQELEKREKPSSWKRVKAWMGFEK
ncbi:MAG TPA: glycosyltransferase [Anaerolineales bacterium]|nr:glycosyltransferase [Anaerolineales bacterium]HNQ95457.1 glycosyltransferase [Anaerolineales bacterium]HNS61475.1 glycosyltransferase [Anaerolineales bacterium]